eukprot:3938197-Rhodomonas_salina.2
MGLGLEDGGFGFGSIYGQCLWVAGFVDVEWNRGVWRRKIQVAKGLLRQVQVANPPPRATDSLTRNSSRSTPIPRTGQANLKADGRPTPPTSILNPESSKLKPETSNLAPQLQTANLKPGRPRLRMLMQTDARVLTVRAARPQINAEEVDIAYANLWKKANKRMDRSQDPERLLVRPPFSLCFSLRFRRHFAVKSLCLVCAGNAIRDSVAVRREKTFFLACGCAAHRRA